MYGIKPLYGWKPYILLYIIFALFINTLLITLTDYHPGGEYGLAVKYYQNRYSFLSL